MVDLVAGAIVSRIIDALIDRFTSQEVRSLFQGKKGTSKQLDELTSRLQLTNKLLNDLEVKQLKDEDVKKLLDDLKVLAYEADQAMNKINTEALRRKGESKAELVGGAPLSGFLDDLFDRLASQEVLNFFQGNKVLAKLLDELKIRLLSANKLLNDAELKQLMDEDVQKWLDELKEVLYAADHVMDKINTEALQRKVEEGDQSQSKVSKLFNWMPKLHSSFDNKIKSEIEEILATLDLLLRQKDELGLREGVHQNRPQRLPTPLVDTCDVYGRDAEKEAIVQLLLADDNGGRKLSVVPIVGLGGIGKTTLAQIVYNDSRVQDYFALKVWVTVSEEFDVFKLTRVIIKAITSRKCDIQDLYQLQNALKKELIGKRFLFVHDDVWNENYELWDALKSPFNFGADGSKILVTTRSEIVASKMGTVPAYSLQIISDDDCWKLFANHVFENIGSGVHSDFLKMGKEIVKKCNGLPLSVKLIAGVLRSLSSSEEWRGILQNDAWELQFQENQKNMILPALWLSYQFLTPQLKRCFAYCSIFPKDYEFQEYDKEPVGILPTLSKSAWSKPQGLTPNLLAQLENIQNEHTSSPSRVAHRTHSAKAMSSGKAKKEAMSPVEIMARMTRRKAAARKGKSILSTIKPIMLDDKSLATSSSAHFSTPQSHKRKRDESCKFELNVPDGLPPQQNFSAAAQIGGALKTQVDFDFLSNHSFPVPLEEYVGRAVQNHQLALAMSAKYTAMYPGHTTLIKEREGLLAKLEDERRISIYLEDELRVRLDKAEKLLTEKDELIFELIKEGKDQYTDGWSHARLDTLLQHRDGKLSEKESAAEIQRLTEYFSDSENVHFLSRLESS